MNQLQNNKRIKYYNDLVESGIVKENETSKSKILNGPKLNKNIILKYYSDLRDCGRISNQNYINIENHYNKLEDTMKNKLLQQLQAQQQAQPQPQQQQQVQQQLQAQQQAQPSPVQIQQPPVYQQQVQQTTYNMNTYFDKIYISNLERRKDRLEKVKNRLEKNNITNYQIVNAFDGTHPQIMNEWLVYLRNKKSKINSSGALAYLYTMKNILTDAVNNNYNRILICDDDIIFHKDFINQFDNKVKTLNNFNWKLLYLGASQLNYWDKITVLNSEYYLPKGTTDGSFAVGIDRSIVSELLQTLNGNILPFDTGPLRYIQSKYSNECLVMYPNIVIADVSNSDIQQTPQDIHQYANKCKWNLNMYEV
jgi:GR25 family glycosyltransferase involved in LPS biosynthesis